MAATLLSIFGLLAPSLAAIGLHGVMAYAVSRRTRELGIRIAVGATHGNVLSLILDEGLFLSAIGIAGAVVGALMLTRFLVNLLYGVSPADPVTFAVIPLVLLGVALAAGYLPARRAIALLTASVQPPKTS